MRALQDAEYGGPEVRREALRGETQSGQTLLVKAAAGAWVRPPSSWPESA